MAKFKIGDKVEYFYGEPGYLGMKGTIVDLIDTGSIDAEPDQAKVKIDGRVWAFGIEHLRKSYNSRACNAGKAMISRRGNDWYYAWADGSKDGREGPFRTEEEATVAAKLDGFTIVNSRASNAKFKVGDKVYFYGRPATVKQVIREPDADYILDVQGSDFYAEDDEVTSRNSRACNSSNPVVRKAMNACAMR